jgi:hypothetical protein
LKRARSIPSPILQDGIYGLLDSDIRDDVYVRLWISYWSPLANGPKWCAFQVGFEAIRAETPQGDHFGRDGELALEPLEVLPLMGGLEFDCISSSSSDSWTISPDYCKARSIPLVMVVGNISQLSTGGPRKVVAKSKKNCLIIENVANRGQNRKGFCKRSIHPTTERTTACNCWLLRPTSIRWRAVGKVLVSSRRVLLNRPFDSTMFGRSVSCHGIPVSQNSTGTPLLVDRYSPQAALRNVSKRLGSLM